MSRFKDVKFYSYTNSIPLFRGKDLPDNFCTIYSDGGKLAHTIDKTTERHSMVFKGIDEMLQAGYVNASQNDLMATKWYNKTNKVGLKFH